MKKLAKLFIQAKQSSWGLWKLNFALKYGIPFNRPHGIKIKLLSDNKVQTYIPNWRINHNHIRGIHACGLATVAEFCSGLLLLSRVNPVKYRLIMKELKMNYTFQAKSNTTATFSLEESEFNRQIFQPLEKDGVVLFPAKILLHDEDNNLVAEAETLWQIKSWEKVKTKA